MFKNQRHRSPQKAFSQQLKYGTKNRDLSLRQDLKLPKFFGIQEKNSNIKLFRRGNIKKMSNPGQTAKT